MEALRDTSFDRFARYSYVYELRHASFPLDQRLSILDVGDPYGTLGPLLPADDTVSIDLFIHPDRFASNDHEQLIGSGLALPFPDDAFDLVTSHDTIEHLPAPLRQAFVDELLRVSRETVVLVAPFADPRTAECESIVNAYYVAHVGSTLEPLDEHAGFMLPVLDEITSELERRGVPHVVHSDGWLYHWLAFMLLKAHYVSMGAARLDKMTDTAFNLLLRERDRLPPHYRRAVIVRPPPSASGESMASQVAPGPDSSAEIQELNRVARELIAALPRGDDPSEDASPLRQWARRSQEMAGPTSELARSIEIVFDHLGRATAEPVPPAPPRERDRPRDAVAAALLMSPGADPMTAVVDALDRAGIPWTAIAPGPSLGASRNAAVRSSVADIVVLLDGQLDLADGWLEPLLSKLAPGDGVVATAYTWSGLQSVASELHGSAPDLLLSASALAIDRQAFLDAGGFRDDVDDAIAGLDLAWRLELAGHSVRVVGARPGSTREPLTTGRLLAGLLRMRFTNLEQSNVQRTLPLDVLRIVELMGSRQAVDVLGELMRDLPALAAHRRRMQDARRVADEELFRKVGEPRVTAPGGGTSVVEDVVAPLIGERTVARWDRRVLVIEGAQDLRRAQGVAAALAAGGAEVVVASSREQAIDGVPTLRTTDPDDLAGIAATCAVTVATAQCVLDVPQLLTTSTVLVVDLREGDSMVDDLVLRRGDAFLVATEAQRDYWLGRLAAAGRPLRAEVRRDPALRELIDVVPHLANAVREQSRSRLIKGRDTLVELDAQLVVLDIGLGSREIDHAVALVSDFDRVRAAVPLARLYVLPPAGTAVPSALAKRAMEFGCSFPQEPVTLEARRAIICEADLVVRLTTDDQDTRLGDPGAALDVAAAGAPQLLTESDPGARLLVSAGAARTTDPSSAIDDVVELLADTNSRAALSEAATRYVASLASGAAIAPLLRIAARPWRYAGAHGSDGERSTAVSNPSAPPRDVVSQLEELLAAATSSAAADSTSLRSEIDRLRRELRRAEAAELRQRERVERVTTHPLVRLAIAVRNRVR